MFLPLVLAIWGYGYLFRCFQMLASPGVPIDFSYQAQKGATLHVRADSYSFIWSSGVLQVVNPMLQDSQGQLLASADSARLSGLKFGSTETIEGIVRDLKGKLVRLPDGHFALEEYLPETTNEQQNRPFRVRIQEANLLFEDLSGKGKFDQRALTDDLIVEGIGKDWVASGRLSFPGIGNADVALQRYDKSGLVIALNSPRLELGRVVNHFRTTPEGKGLDLLSRVRSDTLTARGPVRLFIPENKPFLVAASLDARATNVVYEGHDRFTSAHFAGLITGGGASGSLALVRPGGNATFVGASDWSTETNFAGMVDATVANKNAIPASLIKFVPPSINFSGAHGKGWLSYDPKNGFRYDGGVDAAAVRWGKQAVSSAAGSVRAGNGLVRIQNGQGVWQGSLVEGSLAYIPNGRQIIGAFNGPHIQLASVSRALNLKGLSGDAQAQGLLTGSSEKPLVAFRANGNATFRSAGARKPLTGKFHGAANYATTGLDISSIVLDTKTGTVAATGHANPRGALALNVAARGVMLNAFSPDLGGAASFSGDVTGTASDPKVNGKAEVVGLTIAKQEIPVVIADVSADKRGIHATGIDAVRGAAQVSGDLSYIFSNGGLAANLKAMNLPLAEVSDQVSGIVDVPTAKVSGTLANPIVDAQLETHGLVVANRVIGRGKASFSLRGNDFKIPEMRAQFARGTVVASASGNLKSKTTRVEASGTNLQISELAPDLEDTATLGGTVNGLAVLTAVGADVRYARASGKINDFAINQTTVGSGSFSASLQPDAFSGAAQVGSLDRYFDLSHLLVNRKTNTIGANFTAYQIPLPDIYSALARYVPQDASDMERRLLRMDGVLDAEASVKGDLKQPDLMVKTLDLTALSLEGQDLGKFSTSFNRTGRVWTITDANWDGVAGTLRSSGTIDEAGEVAFQGDFTNVDLGLLSMVNDNLTRIRGRAALSFAVSGQSSSPTIQASLDASHTTVLTGTGANSPTTEFGMVLDTINVSESVLNPNGILTGGIEASGKLFYRGFEGNLSSQIPLQYPFTLPQGQPLAVSLSLPERSLESLSEYFPFLDAKRTSGTVAGELRLGGVVGDAALTGDIKANAKTFAVNKVQTQMQDATAELHVNRDALTLHFGAKSSEGGTLSADASMPVGDVADRINELTSRGLEAILDRPISAQLALNDFGMKYDAGPEGRLVGRADANINAAGMLRSPAVTGAATLKGINTLLPSFDSVASEPVTFAVNPTFDIKLTMADIANISTSLARLKMIGGGTIAGSLNEPSLTSDLTVMGGSITLPTATVRIDPGGTVKLRYQTTPNGEALARLDVNLTAHTSLTTMDVGDIPQHYDIDLGIRGDLLQEGQTFITAESDPPGLGQERIMALLGQADLVAALAGSVSKLQASKELRNALAGYAVPALLSPLTNGLAKGLGLDYLNVEYNPFSQVSVSFAKDLGKNFSFQGRRQISSPLPGYKPQYDMNIVYRLPFHGKAFRRTSISFGVDQDRPWKIGIQYGIRF